MFGLPIGPLELILVLAVALLILGPGRLPEVGSAFGKTIREFRKASTEMEEATRLDARPEGHTIKTAAAPSTPTDGAGSTEATTTPPPTPGDDA